jgi:putative transposase
VPALYKTELIRRQGPWRSLERVFEQSLRQRCLVHCSGNILAKVSKVDGDEVKKDYWAIFNDIGAPPGHEAVAIANRRAAGFKRKYRHRYPGAVDCLLSEFSSLTSHLHFPVEHRERIRHTNLLERTFGERRRRVR